MISELQLINRQGKSLSLTFLGKDDEKKEPKRGYETFISKCAPGTVVEDLYQTKNVPTIELPQEQKKPQEAEPAAKPAAAQQSNPPNEGANGGQSCCIY